MRNARADVEPVLVGLLAVKLMVEQLVERTLEVQPRITSNHFGDVSGVKMCESPVERGGQVSRDRAFAMRQRDTDIGERRTGYVL